MVADAAEEAEMTAIASAIQRLPVESEATRMSAAKWVMAPGEMETEGVEMMAKIAARLLDREIEDEDDGEPDSNHVETSVSNIGRSKTKFVESVLVCGGQHSFVLR